MFNKTKTPPAKPQPTVAPVAPAVEAPNLNLTKKPSSPTTGNSFSGGAKPFSSVGSGLLIDGNVTGTGDLHLDGTVKGDVRVNHLTVGESGNIEGKVEAETIEVRGRIVGSIQGKQVKLQATAYVEGDITHETLAIDVGAYFQGRCLQRRSDSMAASVASPAANVSPAAPAAPASPAAPAAPAAPSGGMSSYDMSALSDLT
ncbi:MULTISPECIES: polymer-forming cytoskeletal protein [Asticcacaulis]|uniref:bactofilin family protein n=1 Tax=Asticcacaulis TaxID=76890 RepID=UPI001AE9FD45|nr:MULTISPECIES: polymer-forming cytoskeletal protein [Asticcacaulis]MBP2158176.1 cytoskeletal protein CcmA (bactofilin family) [Asticcacaulis solisilvae]MDR6799221.1 cytoskeletal protein CcmA (bactofilin family) [Asticcacaulis sp. BE141]